LQQHIQTKPHNKNDFFTKNRVKTALRVGSGDIRLRNRVRNALQGWKSVFDQTFVKSLVNSLRVRNALLTGLAIYFFVDENGAYGD
jgi:hypothetical protein